MNPTGGAAAWHVVQLDESLDLRGVSCGSPGFCLAVADQGRLVATIDPTGGVSAWKEVGTPGGPGTLQGVSCVATLLCVVGNEGGNLLASTYPGVLSSWDEVPGGSSVLITAVDCLPSRQCVAVDNNGNVLTSNDPTAGRGAWSLVKLIAYVDPATPYDLPFNALFGVSCPSSSLCAISAADGRIYTNTDPFGAPSGQEASKQQQQKGRRPKRPRTIIADRRGGFPVGSRHMKSKVLFRFHAKGKVRGFLCKRDRGPFKPCHSPVRYWAAVGKHVFRVRAIGMTGLRGPVASEHFEIQLSPFHRH